jgi:hypothetical protein
MENSRKIHIQNNAWLHIEMHTKSIAVAYLYDADNCTKINIPSIFKVIDLTNNIEIKQFPDSQMFALCGSDNYSFLFNNKEITNTTNQRI